MDLFTSITPAKKSMLRWYFTLATAFFCVLPSGRAQSVDWSPPRQSDDRSAFTSVLGENKDGIYIVRQNYRQRRRNIIIEQYSEDLKPLVSKAFLTRKDEFLLQILLQPHEIQLFYGSYSKESKTDNIYVKRLKPDLSPMGTDSLLFTLEDKDLDISYIQVLKPRNYNYTLIINPRQNAAIPVSYAYMLMDSSLHLLSKGELDFDISSPYVIEQVAYTKEEISLLLREEPSKKDFRDDFRFSILYGKLSNHLLRTYPLYNDSINISDGLLKADYINHSFRFTGLYFLKDSNYSKGYYIWFRNLDSQQTTNRAIPFTQEVIQDVSGRFVRSGGINDLRIGDIMLRQDGGIILVAEEYRSNREMFTDMNLYGTISQNNIRYYFYYNNILVLSMDAEGRQDWYKVLHKDQVSVNDNGIYSSYLLHAMPDRLIFVYNDLARKRWILSDYEVNAAGLSEDKVLLKAQEYDGRLIPRDGSAVSARDFIIPGFTEKGQVLVRFRY